MYKYVLVVILFFALGIGTSVWKYQECRKFSDSVMYCLLTISK